MTPLHRLLARQGTHRHADAHPPPPHLRPAAEARPVFLLEEVREKRLLLAGHHLVERLVLLAFPLENLRANARLVGKGRGAGPGFPTKENRKGADPVGSR